MNYKTLSLIFLLSTILFITGCEKVDIVEIELPYHEKIVVNGIMQENVPLNGIHIYKTLPLDEEYSINKAEIRDAIVYIQEGVKIIPLKFVSNGLYRPLSSFIPQKSKTYEFFAKWNDKNVYAKTYVPANPKIISAYLITDASGSYIQAEIQNEVGAIFGAKCIVMEGSSVLYESNDIYNVSEHNDDKNAVITIRTPLIPRDILNTFKNNLSIKVFAFDKQFYNYSVTKKYSFPVKDTFVQSGGEVEWNVYGDGIGLFLGYSITTKKIN